MTRCPAIDLGSKRLHDIVDRSLSPCPVAPHALEELSPRDDASLVRGERVEETELGPGQTGARAVDVGLERGRVEA